MGVVKVTSAGVQCLGRQGCVIVGREVFRDVARLERNEEIADATLLLGHGTLDHLAAGARELGLERGQNRVVQRCLTAGKADADKALASDLVLEDVQWSSRKVLPSLLALAVIDLVLRKCQVRLKDDIVGRNLLWGELRKVDLLVVAALFVIFRRTVVGFR